MACISLFRSSAALRSLATLLACLSFAPYLRAQSTPTSPEPPRDLTVLILGDSLSLCGFGKRLDQKFRGDLRVKSVFTYCTCGTNPLSWLKEKPYAHVQTHCGYLSIESLPDSHAIKELRDIYGMTRGHTPKSHPVPKLEDLLAKIQPDILVMQTGANLFGLFSGREKVKPDHDAAMLRKYLVPFVKKAVTPSSSVQPLTESFARLTTAETPVSTPSATPATASLIVKAKLVSKTKPIRREQLLPYQEFLVGFVYDVEEVIAGEYGEKQVLVMHPAYIGLHPQSLGKFRIGRSYELQLRGLDGSIWSTVKSKDDSGRIDLEPYIRIQDEARYPKSAR